jgi:carboxypeptidase family protein
MILICRSFSVRHLAIGIAISFALLFWAADPAAQASRVRATVEGIVRDTSRAVIPSSKVTVHNPLTNQSRTVTTNEQGFFRAGELSVGTYEVRVEQTGFAPYRQAGVGASLGQTIHPG